MIDFELLIMFCFTRQRHKGIVLNLVRPSVLFLLMWLIQFLYVVRDSVHAAVRPNTHVVPSLWLLFKSFNMLTVIFYY